MESEEALAGTQPSNVKAEWKLVIHGAPLVDFTYIRYIVFLFSTPDALVRP